MTSDRVAAAHAKVTATKSNLAAVDESVESARAYVAEIEIEVADHVKKSDASVTQAAALAQSLRVGKPATFPRAPFVAVDRTARRSAEERLKIAEFALDELVAEQNEAQAALDKATEALHAAARAVLAQEGHALVAKIDKLEGESLRTRVAVESLARSGVLGWGREIGLNDAAMEILRTNTLLPLGIRNHGLWHDSNTGAELVRQRFAALIQHQAPATRAA